MTGLLNISASMQDYLEAILEISESERVVRITDIANRLNIAKASVNQTIGKLKEMGLVTQQIYGPVELTGNGKKLADKVRQRHRKLLTFLVDVLGVEPKIAEKDACLMEHVVSSQTMERLTEFLVANSSYNDSVKSTVDHREESYGKEAGLKPMKTRALSELKIGQKGKVIKIASKGTARKRILEMGITTGTEISVKGLAPFGDPMELIVKGYSLSLRKEEAADIFVEVQ